MKELNTAEIEIVSGAGIISDTASFVSGFAGDVIIDTVKLANDALNTRLISSVGQGFNAIGFGLGAVHNVADSLGYAAFKSVAAVGSCWAGMQAVSNIITRKNGVLENKRLPLKG